MDPREQGLRAFRAGRWDQAISLWSDLAGSDPRVAGALAEAYARRARSRVEGSDPVADLKRATELAPQEIVYRYHLGLACHRAGDLPAAIEHYRAVLAHDPAWPGVGMALALALLEQDEATDLAATPDIPPAVRAALAPVQAVLLGDVPSTGEDTPMGRLWRGLALVRTQREGRAAADVLDDPRPLPSARAETIRRLYKGVAEAQADDVQAALTDWERAYRDEERARPPQHRQWLLDNLAVALTECLDAQLGQDDLEGATATARRALALPNRRAPLSSMVVQALDRAARGAAHEGDWARAAQLWDEARNVVSSSAGLGSPRPLLHNLALAHEAQENWAEAAEAWRAMLRTRPRTATEGAGGGPSPAQWAWVRKRVIECYQRAGQPAEAVAVFRQAVKADPSDLDTRLQLAAALEANEQDQAAINELHRILEVDPGHVEARLQLASVHDARGEWWAAEGALREVLRQHPEREDVTKRLARLLLERGEDLHERGFRDRARKVFQEGQQLAPEDYRFPLNLARLAIDERKSKQARDLLERTLELGADQPDAYIQVIHCWSVADDLDKARGVLARAEAAGKASPELYVGVGTLLVGRAARYGPLMASFALSEPSAKADDPWSGLGVEALDRAMALRPDDPHLRFGIAAELMTADPGLAISYVEAGLELAPDDVRGLALLGLLQALDDKKREAKKTLQRAAKLAREQGDPELVRHVEDIRSQINSPLLRLAIGMGPLLEGIDDEDLDFDDLFE
jgi:tetratricopeptide (TPR) repeat protein